MLMETRTEFKYVDFKQSFVEFTLWARLKAMWNIFWGYPVDIKNFTIQLGAVDTKRLYKELGEAFSIASKAEQTSQPTTFEQQPIYG